MWNLAQRDRRAERMDQPGLPPPQHHQALDALRRVNMVSRTSAVMWQEIQRIAAPVSGHPLRILDVACGGGDVAIELARRARAARIEIEVAGCDLSETAVRYAKLGATKAGLPVQFSIRDVLRDGLPDGFDVICTSLFLHHLDEADVGRFLGECGRRACQALVVSDLVRSRRGYLLAWLGSHFLTRSPIVHYDAPVSVRAAFTVSEMEQLAADAGLVQANIQTYWPARFLLSWRAD